MATSQARVLNVTKSEQFMRTAYVDFMSLLSDTRESFCAVLKQFSSTTLQAIALSSCALVTLDFIDPYNGDFIWLCRAILQGRIQCTLKINGVVLDKDKALGFSNMQKQQLEVHPKDDHIRCFGCLKQIAMHEIPEHYEIKEDWRKKTVTTHMFCTKESFTCTMDLVVDDVMYNYTEGDDKDPEDAEDAEKKKKKKDKETKKKRKRRPRSEGRPIKKVQDKLTKVRVTAWENRRYILSHKFYKGPFHQSTSKPNGMLRHKDQNEPSLERVARSYYSVKRKRIEPRVEQPEAKRRRITDVCNEESNKVVDDLLGPLLDIK